MPPVFAQFVHNFDQVMIEFGGLRLWYYGTAYAVGFVGVLVWLWWRRQAAGLAGEGALDFAILFGFCVLVFGRLFEIVVYEWPYYLRYPTLLPCFWRGGMASHGVLLGGVIAVTWYGRRTRRSFFPLGDEIVIPAALFLALGRIGNFITGDIIGTPTDGWWGVRFPGDDLYRHPVTLYEGLKNLLLIPILLIVRKNSRGRSGLVFGHFVFWYGFLRVFVDFLRDYGHTVLGIGTGQYFNLAMSVLGLLLIQWRRSSAPEPTVPPPICAPLLCSLVRSQAIRVVIKTVLWLGLLLLAMSIPCAWTLGYFEEFGRE